MADTTQIDLPAVRDDGELGDTAVPRAARRRWLVIGSLVAVSLMASWLLAGSQVARFPEPSDADKETVTDGARFNVVIRQPAGPPRTELGISDGEAMKKWGQAPRSYAKSLQNTDIHSEPVPFSHSLGAGDAVTAACSTCHATREPDRSNRRADDLQTFHQGLVLAHGHVSCLSCHNAANYDSLMLADGTPVAFTDVMQLCGQCHGPQTRDYHHGAHGGMTGYWDLSRGPRQRNNCVDCHDPHAPAFPKMIPTFKPRDRFLEPPNH